ncbi:MULTISPECIES: DUF4148 domain-containing protein [unclassified Bordetella]|uniref:DUF4148 domain-containing protein n=1 Tax=unclassified Bordetella TaxID=2630031 RepID=UPI001EF114D5|nr:MULTISPECIES: DUF4148 domain-containing protein [unclassified Bordetella]
MKNLKAFFLTAVISFGSYAQAQPGESDDREPHRANVCNAIEDDSEQPVIRACQNGPGKTTSQVREELLQAKAAGLVTFGELDYPPSAKPMR